MQIPDIHARLIFLREAERLKDVLRTAHTRTGKQESTAEHTWRLGLFILSFADQLPDLDLLKVLKMALLHDLGEAIHGDIPAINQQGRDKLEQERADLVTLMHTLPTKLQVEFLSLWDEYNQAQTLEAQAVKAFDKLETILQHNQGANPPAFDYAFNLTYGQRYTQINPLFAAIRALLDAETRQLALQQVPAMNIEFLAVDDELEKIEHVACIQGRGIGRHQRRELLRLATAFIKALTARLRDRPVADAVAEVNPAGPKDMGRVVKAARAALAGKTIDGGKLAGLVKAELNK